MPVTEGMRQGPSGPSVPPIQLINDQLCYADEVDVSRDSEQDTLQVILSDSEIADLEQSNPAVAPDNPNPRKANKKKPPGK